MSRSWCELGSADIGPKFIPAADFSLLRRALCSSTMKSTMKDRARGIGECHMIRSPCAVAAALIAASISFSQPVFSEEETDQRFGTVHFDTSCNDIAQRRFDRAMRYQHSFWYRESRELFEEVLKSDPDCGI